MNEDFIPLEEYDGDIIRIDRLIDFLPDESWEWDLQGKINLDDIAYKCGFASASYFIEKFKLQTGMSPFIYRKKKF